MDKKYTLTIRMDGETEQEMARLNVIRKIEEYDRKHGIIDGNRSSLFEAG